MKKTFILVMLISLLFSSNSFSQQDSCSRKQQASLSLLYDYNTVYSLIRYFEIYLQLDKDLRISVDLKNYYQDILDLACSIFTEDDLVRLNEMAAKYRITNLSGLNSLMNRYQELDYSIDELIKLMFHEDPEYLDIIEKYRTYVGSVINTVQTKFIEKQIIKDGYTPDEGLLDYYLGNYSEALRFFNGKIITEKDTSFTHFLFRAKCYFRSDMYTEAISAYKEAISINKEHPDAYRDLAAINLYVYENDTAAFTLIEKSLSLDPDNYAGNLLLGDIFGIQSHYDKALSIFSGLVSREPERIDAYLKRAFIYTATGDLISSKHDFYSAMEIDSNDVEALYGLSGILLDEMKVDSAYLLLKRGLKQYPDNYDLNSLLGTYYMQSERYDSCILCYSKLVLDSLSFIALNNLGFCQIKSEMYDEAIITFRKMIDELPLNDTNLRPLGFAYNNLGQCYMRKKMYEEAIESIEYSLSLYPENPCALINKVMVEDQLGKGEDPCSLLEMAKEMPLIAYCGEDVEALVKSYCKKKGKKAQRSDRMP